ncbi:MAG: nucleotide exchange factor GrpE [Aquificaceae bacterium]|nr:nucleotide exchange factor GrpE [Aquificaceae bacterium]MDW8237522.1 nucleotide exchange factor GrpE [Aquificaceae bacterium]
MSEETLNRDEVEELKAKLAKLEQSSKAINARYIELQSQLETLKEHYRREIEAVKLFGLEKLMVEILNIVDSLENALAFTEVDFESLRKGVELTHQELLRVLQKHGLCEVDVLGKVFDPYVAEAIDSKAVGDCEEGVVIEVERKGYMLNGKLIRPARVIVCKKDEPTV